MEGFAACLRINVKVFGKPGVKDQEKPNSGKDPKFAIPAAHRTPSASKDKLSRLRSDEAMVSHRLLASPRLQNLTQFHAIDNNKGVVRLLLKNTYSTV